MTPSVGRFSVPKARRAKIRPQNTCQCRCADAWPASTTGPAAAPGSPAWPWDGAASKRPGSRVTGLPDPPLKRQAQCRCTTRNGARFQGQVRISTSSGNGRSSPAPQAFQEAGKLYKCLREQMWVARRKRSIRATEGLRLHNGIKGEPEKHRQSEAGRITDGAAPSCAGNEGHTWKHCPATQFNSLAEALANPPHRNEACSTANPTRPRHRMVALAARPPGPSAPPSSQSEKATVMLGICGHILSAGRRSRTTLRE